MKIADRIEIDPKVLHGKPYIAGTRIPVDIIPGLLADGLTVEQIVRDHYPHIKKEDILACIRYAKEVTEEEEIYPVEIGK